MINDRGSIKWTTLMLPEHVELLRNLRREEQKITKPILDSQEIELIDHALLAAYETNALTEITIYSKYGMKIYLGRIVKLQQQPQSVLLKLEEDLSSHSLRFTEIMAVELKE